MNYVEKTAKTVDEAIALALQELNIAKDEAEIIVLSEGKQGFLGIGKKEATVRVTQAIMPPDPKDVAVKFLRDLVSSMKINAEVNILRQSKKLLIGISGENMGILIGKRGQTLEAIQYLTNLVANKGQCDYVSIVIDIENYREKRRKSLEILAKNLAKKAKLTKKVVALEPMSSNERRIIHYTLENDKEIKTYSQGEEPRRYVVIELKK